MGRRRGKTLMRGCSMSDNELGIERLGGSNPHSLSSQSAGHSGA